jgi:hypothetical protein
MILRRSWWLAGAVLLVVAAPAGADWLVMRDGSRVESSGPWTAKGRLIVFTSTDGKLVSLRADDLDLAASRRATEEMAAAPAAEPAPGARPVAAEPVRRITNADIAPGAAPPPAVEGEGVEAAVPEPPAGSAPAAASELIVIDSQEAEDPIDGHLIVTGSIANGSEHAAAAIRLLVRSFGPEGHVLGEREAELEQPALAPGATTGFRAEFPDVFSSFAVSFSPQAVMLRSGSGETPEEAPAESPEPPLEP